MNALTLDNDTVLMPVPLRWAQQVAEYVAELKTGRTVRTAGTAVDAVTVPGQGEWTQSMVKELAEAIPYAGVLALFGRCAEVSGTWVLKSEVEETQGVSAIQMRNELGALSKLTKRLFKTEKPTWPVQWKKEQGSYYYRMDAQVAQWWEGARSAA